MGLGPVYVLLLSNSRLSDLSLLGEVTSQSDTSFWASADKIEAHFVH